MPIQLYICNQIGTGTKLAPYRPAIAGLPIAWDGAGENWYTGADHPARRFWIGIVYGSDATHDLCETVATPLLPARPGTAQALKASLDDLLDSETPARKQLLTNAIESLGVSAAWVNPTSVKRDLIRYIFRACYFANMAEGEGNPGLLNLLSRNLDVTVAEIPQAIRQAGRDWIEARGLSAGWITNQTTVRQIVHYVIENLGFGVIRFQGEMF